MGIINKPSAFLEPSPRIINFPTVVAFHLLFAFIIFSPFFLSGQIMVASTDNFYTIFPNLIFNHRSVNNGELGLWNPYILSGIDFSSSTQNLIYYPIYWIFFVFPEKYFFYLTTFQMFVEMWLIGVFGFLFFREELEDDQWAFFSSIAYQLCGTTFLGLTNYPSISMFLFMTIGLYLIWTLGRRKLCWSYIFLALCMVLIITCVNIVYAFGAFLVMVILFIYRNWPCWGKGIRTKLTGVFLAAITTSVLISMIRLFPIAMAIPESTRLSGDFTNWAAVVGRIFLLLPVFIPESLGVHSVDASMLWKVSPTVKGIHPQFHGFTYFGTLPVIFAVYAVISLRDKKVVFWLIYLLFATSYLLKIRPISDIIHLILYPLIHGSTPKIMIPIAFCALAGHAGKNLTQNYSKINPRHLKIIAVVFCAVFLSILMTWVYSFKSLITPIRVVIIISPFLIWAVFKLWKIVPSAMKYALIFSGFVTVGQVAYVAIDHGMAMNKYFLWSSIYLLISITSISFLFYIIFKNSSIKLTNRYQVGFVALIGLGFSFLLIYPLGHLSLKISLEGTALLTTLGILRFVVIAVFIFTLINLVSRKKISPTLIPIVCILIVVFDLIPFNKEFSRQIMNPFSASNPYPPNEHIMGSLMPLLQNKDGKSKTLNYQNFRINHPYTLLGFSGRKSSELPTNIHLIYQLNSYGGVNSQFGKTYLEFLKSMSSSVTSYAGKVVPKINDNRLLDLLGVRYDGDDYNKIIIRPGALSRFMFFSDFEVIEDKAKIIKRLKDPKFSPKNKLILSSLPKHLTGPTKTLGRNLNFTSLKTSVIQVSTDTEKPGIVLFNDTFHKGWKAFVNGKQNPILRANYNFMATSVPAGKNNVVFRFEPQRFYYGLLMTAIGGGLLVLISIGLILVKSPSKNEELDPDARNIPLRQKVRRHIGEFKWSYSLLGFFIGLGFLQTAINVDYKKIPVKISASSVLRPPHGPEKILTEISPIWHAQSPPEYPEWVEMKYSEPVEITVLKMKAQGSVKYPHFDRAPRHFFIQGSIDRKTWANLLEVKDARFSLENQWLEWKFDNEGAFQYYRILIMGNGGDRSYLTINQITME